MGVEQSNISERLVVAKGLVEIAGPDGSGKSNLAGELAGKMSGVRLIETAVSGGNHKLLDDLKADNKIPDMDDYWVAKQVIWYTAAAGLIGKGGVILVHGAIDLVRWSEEQLIRSRTEVEMDQALLIKTLEKRKALILKGVVTRGVLPEFMINVRMSPEELLLNNRDKLQRSKFDPTRMSDVMRLLEAQQLAEEWFLPIVQKAGTRLIEVENIRVKPERVQSYISGLVEGIITEMGKSNPLGDR